MEYTQHIYYLRDLNSRPIEGGPFALVHVGYGLFEYINDDASVRVPPTSISMATKTNILVTEGGMD